jgi:hypothetical protein
MSCYMSRTTGCLKIQGDRPTRRTAYSTFSLPYDLARATLGGTESAEGRLDAVYTQYGILNLGVCKMDFMVFGICFFPAKVL